MGPEAHAESEVVGSHAHLPVVGRLAVSVVTPVGRLLAHAADEVVAPGADGEFGVLTGHVPFLAALRPGVLLVRDDKERKILAVGSGYLQVDAGGRTQILVERAAWPADIDVEEARAEKAKLEAEIKELRARAEARAVPSVGARRRGPRARSGAAAAKHVPYPPCPRLADTPPPVGARARAWAMMRPCSPKPPPRRGMRARSSSAVSSSARSIFWTR